MMRLIYPEERAISETEIISWAKDRMIDNALQVERVHNFAETGARELTDEQVEDVMKQVDTPDLQSAIEWLQDAGVATFRKAAW